MDTHNLIHMANRIGQFFESFSDHAEALEGIANHIQKFWEPRMRTALLEQLDQTAQIDQIDSGGGLSPLVAEALRAHRARLLPLQRQAASAG